MNPFAERVRRAIGKGLPGTEVQWEMASSDRMMQNYPRQKNSGSKIAAVLILLYPVNGLVHTLFIQRPVYNGIHSGQISFPGGKVEAADANIIATALREAAEETGVEPDSVTILGTLTPLYIYVSDTEVTPVVGWCDEQPRFSIDAGEVVHIIEAPVPVLADKSIISEKPFMVRETEINVKYFDYKGAVIWGATAMILHELLTILKRENTGFIV
jgi:8-oxo-dGTP pyrophosphatase MutT (NUDIX family)